jgi:hypothetical protein
MTITIDVRSRFGNNERWKSPSLPAWARIWGFDCAMWGDFDENLPTNTQSPYSDEAPEAGAKRTMYVYEPFRAVSGDPVWVLYRARDSQSNGWEDRPEDIDSSALVRCDLVEVLNNRVNAAWIAVKVLEVVPLPDLVNRFDESSGGEIPLAPAGRVTRSRRGETSIAPCRNPPHSITRTEHWLLLDWNLEGDIGEWILCRKTVRGYSLVLYGFWALLENYLLAGNRKLSPSELIDLNTYCGEAVFGR